MMSPHNNLYSMSTNLILAAFSLYVILELIAPYPSPKYPNLEIKSISVSNLNLSNPISAHWNINMEYFMKFHGSDITFKFNDIKISIFHESEREPLWIMSHKLFVITPKNPTTNFVLDFRGSSADVDDTTIKAIVEKIVDNRTVKFKIRADAWLGIRFKHRVENWLWNRNIKMLVNNCDVELLFGTSEKRQADMSMNDSHACTHKVFYP